ncbi:hypothetical protein C7212DRAFT_361869 [Tuber magnatum]|uniref:F-box domain-containing protein n=1 Tax=Tuber magnatum TaxID=42249 RepID=A0A317SXH6_9PEZI|nr:hypothetical protein C7212DRAFT_361869 [Tuber magnatum]
MNPGQITSRDSEAEDDHTYPGDGACQGTNLTINSVPNEILEQILAYLEAADLARMARVSIDCCRVSTPLLYRELRFDPYAYRESQLRVLKSSRYLSSLVRRLRIDIAPLKRDPFQDEIQEFNWGHPLLKDEPPVLTARTALLGLIPNLTSLESVECYDLSGEAYSSQLSASRSLMRCLFKHCPKLKRLTRTDWWSDLGCGYEVRGWTTNLVNLTISVPESYFAVDELVGVEDVACRELRALLRASPLLRYLDFYRGRVSMGIIFAGSKRSYSCRSSSTSTPSSSSSCSSSFSSSGTSTSTTCTNDDASPLILLNLRTLVLWATFVEEKPQELVSDYLSTSSGFFPSLTGLELVTVRCSKEGSYLSDHVKPQDLFEAIATLKDVEVKSITETQIYDFMKPLPSTEELHSRKMMEKHGRQDDRKSRFREW